jgi:hypothetical protein
VTGGGHFTISPSSVASGGASHQIKAWAAGALEMRPKGIVQTTNEKRSARLGRSEDYAQGQADFEMANLRPERTGLPLIVFISQKGGARHDVRIKVARAARVRPSEMVTVAIRPSVRVVRGRLDAHDLALLTQWIDVNRDTLIDYWNGIIEYTEDAMNAIKPIKPGSA